MAARDWLVEQRSVHGLLRALHTADAAGREARVAAVLGRVDREIARVRRRHWLVVTAAALLLATFGIWLLLPPELPTAEAAMARAVDQLGRDLDRRFRVVWTAVARDGVPRDREFTLVTRPGMNFLIEGQFPTAGMRFADGRIGCDGQTIWIDAANGRTRRAGPLTERSTLLQGLGELFDLGYLDLQGLLGKLPGTFRLRVVERLQRDGGPRLRIRARLRGAAGRLRLRAAELIVDEASGMVTRLDLQVRGLGGVRRLVLDYLGPVEGRAVDYARPW